MKKSSLALITSAIISLPLCSMEIKKTEISPHAKECLEIMQKPTIDINDGQQLVLCYCCNKQGYTRYEQCAELIDTFISKTSKENCTIALKASILIPNQRITTIRPEIRIELMKKLIDHQADPNPALKQLPLYITLNGPDYHLSEFVTIANTLWEAKAFDKEAIESFRDVYRLFLNLADHFEKNEPK